MQNVGTSSFSLCRTSGNRSTLPPPHESRIACFPFCIRFIGTYTHQSARSLRQNRSHPGEPGHTFRSESVRHVTLWRWLLTCSPLWQQRCNPLLLQCSADDRRTHRMSFSKHNGCDLFFFFRSECECVDDGYLMSAQRRSRGPGIAAKAFVAPEVMTRAAHAASLLSVPNRQDTVWKLHSSRLHNAPATPLTRPQSHTPIAGPSQRSQDGCSTRQPMDMRTPSIWLLAFPATGAIPDPAFTPGWRTKLASADRVASSFTRGARATGAVVTAFYGTHDECVTCSGILPSGKGHCEGCSFSEIAIHCDDTPMALDDLGYNVESHTQTRN